MENFNFWLGTIITILTGLATAIPLIVKLVQTVKETVRAKNWAPIMQIVLRLMTEAEQNYTDGVDKKEYVLDSVIAMKDTLNYEIDIDVVSAMIDSIVAATKKINVK